MHVVGAVKKGLDMVESAWALEPIFLLNSYSTTFSLVFLSKMLNLNNLQSTNWE